MSKLFNKTTRFLLFFCLVLILIYPVAMAVAEEAQDPNKKLMFKTEQSPFASKEDIFNQRIALELRDMDVVEALRFLASKIGLNLVTTKSVAGRVSLTVDDVPVKDIFDIMLRSNSLAYVKQGEIYTIMTEAEYKALYGKSFSDMRRVKMLRLTYAVPEQAFTLLDALKSDIGRIVVDQESGNVLIMDTPERTEQMQEALAEFEKTNMVEVFNLKYAKAKEVEEILKSQLDAKKVGSIRADERNNQVIVQALSERMQEIAGLISNLDKQTKQVLIDAKIIKIKLSKQLDEGVEWEGLFSMSKANGISYLGSYPYSGVQAATDTWESRDAVRKALGDSIGSYPFSGTTTNYAASTKQAPGQGIHYGTINNKNDYDLLINFLQTLGDTKVLSNPKLVAVNNQEAKIHVGERQAYVTTTTTTGQTTSTIAEEVQFVDVGIQLSVIPSINDDGYVTMKIKPEVSSVSSVLITPTNNRIPIIDTSISETTVMVKDGTTIIIGGMRKEEKMDSYEQLPFLGNIPFLKHFTRSGYGKTERTELLVLITPHIISGVNLTTGDDRIFAQEPGSDYRDYQAIIPDKTLASKDTLPLVEPKPYRDFKEEDEGVNIKEPRYEPQ